jgi:hypothetical protein
MDWDDELCVSVRIPHGEDLDDLDTDVYCWAVPGPLVESTIDTLQALLVLWRDEVGNEPDDDKWGPLLAAAGYVLGGLLHVEATRNTRQGARRLVHLMARSWGASMERHLEALRQEPETDYTAFALLSVHEEAERRHKEGLRQNEERRRQERKQQVAAGDPTDVGRGPAASVDRDPGWEF